MSIELGFAQPATAGPSFVDDVCALLRDLQSEPIASSLLEVERLKSRVFRVSSRACEARESVVVKRITPALAERNERVIQQWLPCLGLVDAAPALLRTVGDRCSTFVWQVYEDLGTTVLDARNPEPVAVTAAVERIAQLHTRAAGHPLLAECARHLDDLGIRYFISNVGDAIAGLQALSGLEATFTPAECLVRDRLLERLRTLRESGSRRARLAREAGGPHTLLHGDLWDINTVVISTSDGIQARFIDWDRAGVGPVAYDVSTLLFRFAPAERAWILQRYRDSVGRAGWHLPDAPALNVLFETAECARYANRVIWPAAALLTGGGDAEHRELAEILGWFEALEPVLQG